MSTNMPNDVKSCSTQVREKQKRAPMDRKTAIVVLSDPKSGSDESLGRLFNALAAAYDFQQRGEDVRILFQGAGTRWIAMLVNKDHPAHELYKVVKGSIEGVSCGCADVFGGGDEATRSGFDLIKENSVPGTAGLPSLSRLVGQGYSIQIF